MRRVERFFGLPVIPFVAMSLFVIANGGAFEGIGSKEAPILIAAAGELFDLARRVNEGDPCNGIYLELTESIDL